MIDIPDILSLNHDLADQNPIDQVIGDPITRDADISITRDINRQGGQKWLNDTAYSVGGSSIGYITGSNKYKSLNDFVSDRVFTPPLDESSRIGNFLAMNFGSWGEDIIRLYLEEVTGATIEIRGAIPYKKTGERLNIHYSMDGIFRVNAKKKLAGADFFPNKEVTYLLEVKCPWSRQIKTYKSSRVAPKGSCKVLKSYEEQVKMGLVIIEDAQAGMFIDCLLRICTLPMLKSPFAVSDIHRIYPEEFTQIMASGATLIYIDNILESKYFEDIDYIKDLFTKIPNTFDFGTAYATFVIKKRPKKWREYYVPQTMGPIDFGNNFGEILSYLKEDEKGIAQFRQKNILNLGLEPMVIPAEPNLLGYIPWKLFDLKYAFIKKDPKFLDALEDKMIQLSELMYKCNLEPEEEKKISILDESDLLA